MKKTKYYLIAAAGAALFALGLFLVKAYPESGGLLLTLPYLCIGVGCGAFGHGLGEILSKKALEKDPEMARRLDIEAKDERNVKHANAAKAKGFDMMTYVFAALLLAFALMNAGFAVIIPSVVAYLFIQFYALYHRFKLDREQ